MFKKGRLTMAGLLAVKALPREMWECALFAVSYIHRDIFQVFPDMNYNERQRIIYSLVIVVLLLGSYQAQLVSLSYARIIKEAERKGDIKACHLNWSFKVRDIILQLTHELHIRNEEKTRKNRDLTKRETCVEDLFKRLRIQHPPQGDHNV